MYNAKNEPDVNYKLWVTIMLQCRSINYNTCTLWWGMFIMGEAGGMLEIAVSSAQFYCEPKTALKT